MSRTIGVSVGCQRGFDFDWILGEAPRGRHIRANLRAAARIGAALGLCLAAATVGASGVAHAADEPLAEGKLLLTGGVTSVEGSGGGGIATWSTITGYGDDKGVGANGHFTYVKLPDYELRDYGASVGLFNRVELSYTRQDFDTGRTGGKLGLGNGFTFSQDVYGAKVRVIGDAVYDQDSWLPQISVGAQVKQNNQGAIIHAVGGRSDHGVDWYVSATKVLLDQSLVVDATLRVTKANQTGLLGFGGDRSNDYHPEFEGSVGYLLTKRLLVGVEYRTKPNNLGFAKEDNWFDVFGAYALNKHLSLTAAYADLGSIATFRNERGLYLSLQAGF
jgi:hypothetical protein